MLWVIWERTGSNTTDDQQKPPTQRGLHSLLGTKSVPCTHNLDTHTSSVHKSPQSAEHLLELQHRWGIHTSANLHRMQRAPLSTLHKEHWDNVVIPLCVATPKKDRKDTCPTLWSQKSLPSRKEVMLFTQQSLLPPPPPPYSTVQIPSFHLTSSEWLSSTFWAFLARNNYSLQKYLFPSSDFLQ